MTRHNREDVVLPYDINMALGMYEERVMAIMAARGISFVAVLSLTAMTRSRLEPFMPKDKMTLTIPNISARSDRTEYPMLVTEIESFLAHLRFILEYPFDVVGTAEVYDELIVGQFTHAEFVAFCLYIEGQKKGAGFDLYIGPDKEKHGQE